MDQDRHERARAELSPEELEAGQRAQAEKFVWGPGDLVISRRNGVLTEEGKRLKADRDARNDGARPPTNPTDGERLPVQDRFVGDVGDFGRYGLLRARPRKAPESTPVGDRDRGRRTAPQHAAAPLPCQIEANPAERNRCDDVIQFTPSGPSMFEERPICVYM